MRASRSRPPPTYMDPPPPTLVLQSSLKRLLLLLSFWKPSELRTFPCSGTALCPVPCCDSSFPNSLWNSCVLHTLLWFPLAQLIVGLLCAPYLAPIPLSPHTSPFISLAGAAARGGPCGGHLHKGPGGCAEPRRGCLPPGIPAGNGGEGEHCVHKRVMAVHPGQTRKADETRGGFLSPSSCC